MKKKKILFIHHSGYLGGAGLSLYNIIKSIDREKFLITVLMPEYPCELRNMLEGFCEIITSTTSPKIFGHYSGGISNPFSLKSIVGLLNIVLDKRNIQKYIYSVNPELIIVNSMTLFWIGKIAHKMNIPIYCFHRETYLKGVLGFPSKIIKHGLSKWFQKIIFISKFDLIETGKTKADKMIIYDKVDFHIYDKISLKESREILGLEPDKTYILYLGGISKLKGSHIITKIMHKLPENIVLLFLGQNHIVSESQYYDSLPPRLKLKYKLHIGIEYKTMNPIFKYHIEKQIIFCPSTSHPEIYYKASDLVVFPSTKPHQSRPIYEAGVAKIPIIVSDFKQTAEFALNHFNVLTFKNNNSNSLLNAVNYLIKGSDSQREILVINNFEQTNKNHNMESLKNEISQLLG